MSQLDSKNTHMSQIASSHIAGLDGLKAIAIIGVTLFHMFPDSVCGGYLGVCLFFVITGYLLAYTSANPSHPFSLGTYVMKRLQRIYPPLLITVLATVGIFNFILPHAISAIRMEVLSIFLGYNNWWQISQNANYFTRLINASPFTHLWFIAVEMQYFIIWPILYYLYQWLTKKTKNIYYGITVIGIVVVVSASIMPLLYIPGQDVTRLYYGTDTRLYALLFGAILGLLRANYGNQQITVGSKKIVSIILAFLLLAGLLVAYVSFNGQEPIVYQGGMVLITVGLLLLVKLVECNRATLGNWLDTPILKWLGQQSYGIFLCQYPVLFAFHRLHRNGQISNEYLCNLLIIITILLGATFIDYMTKGMQRISSMLGLWRLCKDTFIRIVALLIVLAMAVGIYGVAISSDQKVQEQNELESRLAAIQAKQDEENEKARHQQELSQAAVKKALTNVAAIGDSVMLGSSDALRNELPGVYIDAKVSRYVGAGLDIAKRMDEEGRLGDVVLVGLGTNGPITGYYEHETNDLINYLGANRHIFWINVYCPDLDWQTSNNRYLEQLAKEHHNITIIDWYGAVSKHPEWLGEDGVHPNDKGVEAYATLVRDSIERRYKDEIS